MFDDFNEDYINDQEDPSLDEIEEASPLPKPAVKINYLANKDLLREIHKSKTSFCEFIDKKYENFDIIINDISDISNQDIIAQAKIDRATRLTGVAFDAAQAVSQTRLKQADFKVDPDTIQVEDIVFRIKTYDHIPLEPGRKKTPKTNADHHVRVNFIPFKHYAIVDGDITEVGRSHSKNGKFCQTHGALTNKLATMYTLLVDKYSQRGNWRGYCVDENTQVLTTRGWISYIDITEHDTILSCDPSTGRNTWSSIKSIFIDNYDGKMHRVTSDHIDALVTPSHKFPYYKGIPNEFFSLTEIESMESARFFISGRPVIQSPVVDHPTSIAGLLKASPIEIRTILDGVFHDTKSVELPTLSTAMYYQAAAIIAGVPSSLTEMTDAASGHTTYNMRITMSIDPVIDDHVMVNYKSTSNTIAPPSVDYKGIVWCPETEYGCFFARRNHKVYLTGNTYLDEMKGQALVQLVHMGLQFDEARSANPFSYFTRLLENSFTRVLNLEKRNQDIRDDLLISNGASPSLSRQMAFEENLRRLREDTNQLTRDDL